jgi:hypothetical protein
MIIDFLIIKKLPDIGIIISLKLYMYQVEVVVFL